MIEVSSWLFLYGVLWALVGQMGCLYVVVRFVERRSIARLRRQRRERDLAKARIVRP